MMTARMPKTWPWLSANRFGSSNYRPIWMAILRISSSRTRARPSFRIRRDLLAVTVQLPDESATFVVMVHHDKSRVGGRAATGVHREGRRVPCSRSSNATSTTGILSSSAISTTIPMTARSTSLRRATPMPPGGPEEIDGPFMVNLTEPLMAIGHVSHGKGPGDSVSEQVNTLDPASRQRNNLARGTNQHTGMILFDQILIPVRMRERYVDGSTKVFNHASALRGSEPTRASDCLPVFADLCLEEREPPPPPVAAVRICALLPNPDGPDDGRNR